MYYCTQVRKLSCCCFNICRLKSLHDCVVGMCSAGSSNVNILHPPSHSPVPGPGIPHPSNSRLVPALFLFLSLSVAHKNRLTLFCPYATTSDQLFPSFLTYYISSFPLCSRPIRRSSFIFLSFLPSFFSLQQTLHLLRSPSSAALSFGFICMAERKGCRQCEQGQQSPPVPIQARAEICNARQHSAIRG